MLGEQADEQTDRGSEGPTASPAGVLRRQLLQLRQVLLELREEHASDQEELGRLRVQQATSRLEAQAAAAASASIRSTMSSL